MVPATIKSSMSFTEKGDESQCEVIDKGIAQVDKRSSHVCHLKE